jgi:hypothetical protein
MGKKGSEPSMMRDWMRILNLKFTILKIRNMIWKRSSRNFETPAGYFSGRFRDVGSIAFAPLERDANIYPLPATGFIIPSQRPSTRQRQVNHCEEPSRCRKSKNGSNQTNTIKTQTQGRPHAEIKTDNPTQDDKIRNSKHNEDIQRKHVMRNEPGIQPTAEPGLTKSKSPTIPETLPHRPFLPLKERNDRNASD